MRRYESVIIFDPALLEEARKQEIEKVLQIFEKQNGTIIKIDHMGKRRLAYEIKKKQDGYYVCFDYYSANNEIIKELERNLRINDYCLKFLTIVLDPEFNEAKLQENADNTNEAFVEETPAEESQTV